MNAASGHERCFQVLLNTVMANISSQVTRTAPSGISSNTTLSERCPEETLPWIKGMGAGASTRTAGTTRARIQKQPECHVSVA